MIISVLLHELSVLYYLKKQPKQNPKHLTNIVVLSRMDFEMLHEQLTLFLRINAIEEDWIW